MNVWNVLQFQNQSDSEFSFPFFAMKRGKCGCTVLGIRVRILH